MLNRRLCRDQEGRLGLVPSFAKVDDLIAIFPGSSIPFLLRKRRCMDYAVVGGCYFHHLMDEEWFRTVEQPKVEIRLV